jgi:hypothetical protein
MLKLIVDLAYYVDWSGKRVPGGNQQASLTEPKY